MNNITNALLKASIAKEQNRKSGLGHQFKSKQRLYKDFADKLTHMMVELDVKDPFGLSMFHKLNNLSLEMERASDALLDDYNDRD